jgi:hypothetical protein
LFKINQYLSEQYLGVEDEPLLTVQLFKNMRITRKLIGFLILSALLFSCKGDENEPDNSKKFAKAVLEFDSWCDGDYTINCRLTLSDNITADGRYNLQKNNDMALDIELSMPINAILLEEGTYVISTERESHTMLRGVWEYDEEFDEHYTVGSLCVEKNNGENMEKPLTGGEFIVTKTGNSYTIKGEFVIDNNQKLPFLFVGNIELFNGYAKAIPETISHVFSKGMLRFLNRKDKYNVFYLALGNNYDDMEYTVTLSDALRIQMYTPSGAEDIIPDGTYEMASSIVDDDINPFLLRPGDVCSYPYGTTYSYPRNNGNAGGYPYAFRAGKVIVKRSNNIYDITYDLTNGIKTIQGTYTGVLANYSELYPW